MLDDTRHQLQLVRARIKLDLDDGLVCANCHQCLVFDAVRALTRGDSHDAFDALCGPCFIKIIRWALAGGPTSDESDALVELAAPPLDPFRGR